MQLGELSHRLDGLGGLGSGVVLGSEVASEAFACIEVYPAATLRARGIDSSGCKGKKDGTVAQRRRVLEAVRGEIGLEGDDARLVGCDDRLDAVLCVLAGADFVRGWCVGPEERQRGWAEVEGWIWVRGAGTGRGR